jgi:hypothetical protein
LTEKQIASFISFNFHDKEEMSSLGKHKPTQQVLAVKKILLQVELSNDATAALKN